VGDRLNDLARLVSISAGDGPDEIFFEIVDADGGRSVNNWQPVSAGEDVKLGDAGASLNRIVETIRPIAGGIVTSLRNSEESLRPNNVEITMGVKLSGEVGFFVAKSSGEASINIKLAWKLD
jgi:hypothetical protein